VKEKWDPAYGDRRQEIVFIGIDMDQAAIRARLDACLVDDPGPGVPDYSAWKNLPDPFPVWRREAA
jgi:hypothetical protein